MKKTVMGLVVLFFACCGCFAQQVNSFSLNERNYFGTTAKAVLLENVEARACPDPDSAIVGRFNKGDLVEITGFSDSKQDFGGVKAYYLKVIVRNPLTRDFGSDNNGYFGWIPGTTVPLPKGVEVSTLSFKSRTSSFTNTRATIELEVNRNGVVSTVKARAAKFKDQKNYYFPWTDDCQGFMYSDPAGIFMWNPDTNEITHVSLLGSDCEVGFNILIEEGGYVLKDSGTGPGVRGISVSDAKTCKKIYSGSYLSSLDYENGCITIAEVCSSWNINRGAVSQESLEHMEQYKASHSAAELKGKDIIVKYSLNLATGTRTFVECVAWQD